MEFTSVQQRIFSLTRFVGKELHPIIGDNTPEPGVEYLTFVFHVVRQVLGHPDKSPDDIIKSLRPILSDENAPEIEAATRVMIATIHYYRHTMSDEISQFFKENQNVIQNDATFAHK